MRLSVLQYFEFLTLALRWHTRVDHGTPKAPGLPDVAPGAYLHLIVLEHRDDYPSHPYIMRVRDVECFQTGELPYPPFALYKAREGDPRPPQSFEVGLDLLLRRRTSLPTIVPYAAIAIPAGGGRFWHGDALGLVDGGLDFEPNPPPLFELSSRARYWVGELGLHQ